MLTSAEVAERLRISRTLLYELRTGGRLPRPVRLGRRILWPRQEIDLWVQAGCPNVQKWEILKKSQNFRQN